MQGGSRMAWIEVHQSLPTHRKTLIMADELGIEPVQVVGHLTCFWLWALDNAADGKIEGLTPRMVAMAAQWKGDPEALVSAMVTAGYIEKDGQTIHDWHDYAGKLIDQRRANAERMRRARAEKGRVARASHVQDTCGARAGATVPNRTVPNQTTPVPPPTQSTSEADPDTAAVGGAQETVDPAGLVVLEWNKLDPASHRSLAKVNNTRFTHARAALEAGVTLDELLAVVREMAPSGAAPWEIKREAVRRTENSRMARELEREMAGVRGP